MLCGVAMKYRQLDADQVSCKQRVEEMSSCSVALRCSNWSS